MKSVIVCGLKDMVDYVYSKGRRERLAELTELYPEIITREDFFAPRHAAALAGAEAIFTTWGFWAFGEREFAAMPELKHVFYAAGATDAFAMPLLERNIALYSAWQANAVPVADYCVGQILLGLKGFYRNSRELRSPDKFNIKNAGPGIYGETVALIGAGAIARRVEELLKAFAVKVVVVPSRPEKRTVSIEEAFRTAFVVSNHLPNRDDNKKILKEEHFRSMREGALFLNTGRGAQVDEPGLIRVLRERADLTAVLDVTDPEPPEADSPLYRMPNVLLSGHIAGSMHDEVVRMADYMIDEFGRVSAGDAPLYRIREELLMTH